MRKIENGFVKINAEYGLAQKKFWNVVLIWLTT